jgi:hypothetical protein
VSLRLPFRAGHEMKIQAQDYHDYDEKRVLNAKSGERRNQRCKNDANL